MRLFNRIKDKLAGKPIITKNPTKVIVPKEKKWNKEISKYVSKKNK